MTFETGIDQNRDPFAGMAIPTSLSIGLMQNISDQRRTVAAMRVVTGTAVAKFDREIGMLLAHRSKRVTTEAKRLGLFDQQIGIGRLMRLMAGGTLSLCIRRMSILEFLWHLGVAFEADIRGLLIKQSGYIRGMRIMTAQTLPLFNRLMNYSLVLFIGHIGVTGVTQVLNLYLQQAAEAGNMGVVAGETITIGCRFMIHPLLKIRAFMAGETVNCRSSNSLAHQQEEKRHGQDYYRS